MTMPTFEPVAWFNPDEDLSDEAFSWNKDSEYKHTVRVFTEDQMVQAYEAGQQAAAPEGWTIEANGEWEIRVVSPKGERWRFQHVSNTGGSDEFIYSLLTAMLAAAKGK